MSYQGDYLAAATVVFNFNTAAFSDGSPITLAGTPALSVYKNSTTESTSGVTLTVDYDSRTGMHHVVIDTSSDGAFYAAANDFDVIITTGTVGGTSVVGRKVGSFSIQNRVANANVTKWNGTAVATPATAGIPEVNVKNINNVSTSAVTTVKAVQGLTTADTIATYTGNTPQTGDAYARIGATGSGLTSLAPASTALSTAQWTNTLATNLGTLAGHDPGTTLGTSTLTQAQVTGGAYALNSSSFAFNSAFDFTTTQKTSIGTAVAASAVASVTGNVGGNVTGSVGSVVAAVGITSNRKKGSQTTVVILMTDATTGAPATGLTVAATISQDAGAPGATANAVSEVGLGEYALVVTAGEMTANIVALQFTAAGANTYTMAIQTQP